MLRFLGAVDEIVWLTAKKIQSFVGLHVHVIFGNLELLDDTRSSRGVRLDWVDRNRGFRRRLLHAESRNLVVC